MWCSHTIKWKGMNYSCVYFKEYISWKHAEWKNRDRKKYKLWFHLYQVLERQAWILVMHTYQCLSGTRGEMKMILITTGAWETFCCDGNILQFHWDCGYSGVHIYQNFIKNVHIELYTQNECALCKLYLNKIDL